ncbi:helix-turn-helix transcriptional regulator [Streptomyces carpaticus]|uniref:MmyB family transcriptional regulator n=1 Tax=Streptomyces carpaticus TaxID=285558 RepID=UPI0021FABD72|nr:helix-turn-helix transcriptional regulator [Streptomyces carpaticus]
MSGTPEPRTNPISGTPLPRLLRTWRIEAGHRLGHDRALTQREVGDRCAMSERWVRKLESGAPVQYSAAVLDRLANALLLGRSERAALYLYTAQSLPVPTPDPDEDTGHHLHLLLRRQPDPAFLTNGVWNMIGYNDAMRAWFPWVGEPDANLMRWIMSPTAREQLLDWAGHARAFLNMLRFAEATHPGDTRLASLLTQALQDPYCQQIWDEHPAVIDSLDGRLFDLRLPFHNHQPIRIQAHLLHPGNRPTHRLAILTQLTDKR